MSLEQDISCLYAAQHFAPHVQLRQPEPPQPQSQFLTKLNEIVEKHGKSVYDEFKGREQELAELEDGTEKEQEKSQSIILGFCTKAYEQLEKEITLEYEKQKSVDMLSTEDKQAYHQYLSELSPEYMFLFLASTITEAHTHLPEREKAIKSELDEWGKQQEQKFENYLASAGINTPEGKTAWKIAHSVAYHFSSLIYFDDEIERIAIAAGEAQIKFKNEAKIEPSQLEHHVGIGIATGLLCAKELAIISEENLFTQTAVQWLTKEIKKRLEKGTEFNLLDAVAIKKGEDGLIYFKLDKHEPYK